MCLSMFPVVKIRNQTHLVVIVNELFLLVKFVNY